MNFKSARNWLLATVAILTISGRALLAGENVISEYHSGPSVEENLCSFGHDEGDNGWGWYRTNSSWRNIGISFKVLQEGKVHKITLFVRNIRTKEPKAAGFDLQLFETDLPSRAPENGRLLSSQRGEVVIDPANSGMYLTFTLVESISVVPGPYYIFTLSWDQEVSASIEFAIAGGYQDGFCWYSDDKNPDGFRILNDQPRPGLIFSIH